LWVAAFWHRRRRAIRWKEASFLFLNFNQTLNFLFGISFRCYRWRLNKELIWNFYIEFDEDNEGWICRLKMIEKIKNILGFFMFYIFNLI
jgi:hypothetical protein